MRIFFDTEFIDDAERRRVDLISIGMVRQDGAEYYAEVDDVDWSRAGDWVMANVFPKLTGKTKPRSVIAAEIREFVGGNPEFWGYFVAYDWLVLCQLYGRMLDTPGGWPNFAIDLQALRRLGLSGVGQFPEKPANLHNALDDARWTKEVFHHLFPGRKPS
jgi:hypothetical protein